MKTTFNLNALVASALPQSTDKSKLTQAVEAYLNAMKAVEEKAIRGGLREIKKTNDARLTETTQTTFAGERNIVSDFLQYHDRVVSLSTKAEKLGCVLNVAEIPPRFANWLGKFAKAEAKAPENKPVGKTNGKAELAATK
jgi:type II secretory pathway pseudopilin PulG